MINPPNTFAEGAAENRPAKAMVIPTTSHLRGVLDDPFPQTLARPAPTVECRDPQAVQSLGDCRVCPIRPTTRVNLAEQLGVPEQNPRRSLAAQPIPERQAKMQLFQLVPSAMADIAQRGEIVETGGSALRQGDNVVKGEPLFGTAFPATKKGHETARRA